MAVTVKKTYRTYKSFRQLTTGALFIAYFLYFFILNRYTLIFQEQNQLFRFSKGYFSDFLSRPGGISDYAGEFLTQFFLFPVAGPMILLIVAFVTFIITVYILKKHDIKGIIYSLIPVLLLAGLHSHYLYKIAYSIGFIFSLGHFALYISLRNIKLRYLNLLLGWPILFYITGGYAFFSAILCLIHELFFNKGRLRFLTSSLVIILAGVTPYLLSNFTFLMPPGNANAYFIPFFIKPPVRYILILLLLYFPFVLVIKKLLLQNLKLSDKILLQKNSLKSRLAGAFLIIIISGLIFRMVYDRKTELMLGMDHFIQNSGWERVLKLSTAYPDTNRLVIFFTNLALYKTGQMSDHLFEYPQAGSNGLWLDWKPDGSTSFFGCEIFYELGYTNEAYRWAFEAMVAIGPNPRSMKLLASTSFINDDLPLASKYLRFLNQSLFYRRWAQHYKDMVSEPFLINEDPTLSINQKLRVHSDFFADNNLNLQALLMNNPENKMAYEYYMASLLLNRNLQEFTEMISYIKNYNYVRLPVHYEEALIYYSSVEKQNFVPEGFSLSQETIRRFQNFAETFVRYANNPSQLEKELKRKHGKTYWYYLHSDKTNNMENGKQY
jgi:hypothetical protein